MEKKQIITTIEHLGIGITVANAVRYTKQEYIAKNKGRLFPKLTEAEQAKELAAVYDACKEADKQNNATEEAPAAEPKEEKKK